MTEHNHDSQLEINNEEELLTYQMKREMIFYTEKFFKFAQYPEFKKEYVI